MSYAQMEGLETPAEAPQAPPVQGLRPEDLIGRRLWLAFAVALLAILAAGMAASFVA